MVLADVQRVHGAGDQAVDLGLGVGLGLLVAVAVDLQGVGVVLEAGAQGAREMQVPKLVGGRVRALARVTGTKAAVMAASVWALV